MLDATLRTDYAKPGSPGFGVAWTTERNNVKVVLWIVALVMMVMNCVLATFRTLEMRCRQQFPASFRLAYCFPGGLLKTVACPITSHLGITFNPNVRQFVVSRSLAALSPFDVFASVGCFSLICLSVGGIVNGCIFFCEALRTLLVCAVFALMSAAIAPVFVFCKVSEWFNLPTTATLASYYNILSHDVNLSNRFALGQGVPRIPLLESPAPFIGVAHD